MRNTLFMPLLLFYEFCGITQQPYGWFPLDSLNTKYQRTKQTNPDRCKPHVFTFNTFFHITAVEKEVVCFLLNPSAKAVQHLLVVVFLEAEKEGSVQKMRAFCLACSNFQIRFLLTMSQLCREVRALLFPVWQDLIVCTEWNHFSSLPPLSPPFSHEQMGLFSEKSEK